MSYSFPADVRQMIDAEMASGRYISEDDLFRDALNALREEQDDLLAIQSALAEIEAGEPGTPLAEAFAEVMREVDEEAA